MCTKFHTNCAFGVQDKKPSAAVEQTLNPVETQPENGHTKRYPFRISEILIIWYNFI